MKITDLTGNKDAPTSIALFSGGAMPKRIVRFATRVNGQRKQLFYVKERDSGDLLIAIRVGTNFEHPERGDLTIKSCHMSLHPPDKGTSGLDTFTQKIDCKDGTQISGALLTAAHKNNAIQPFFAFRPPDLAHVSYNLTDNSVGTLFTLGREHRSELNTFMYAIAAVPSGRTFSNMRIGPQTNKAMFKFSRWHLYIIYTYIHVPALPEGDFRFIATNPSKENGRFLDTPINSTLLGFSSDETCAYMVQMFDELCNALRVRYRKYTTKEHEGFLDNMFNRLWQDPLQPPR